MKLWQEGLLLLAVLWAAQAAGTWMQMRHYGRVMRRIADSWPDGFVGASAARGTFGRGVIAIVVAGSDEIVRQVLLMEGRSVFAKFRARDEAAGRPLAALSDTDFGAPHAGRRAALAGAVAQLRGVLARAHAAPLPA